MKRRPGSLHSIGRCRLYRRWKQMFYPSMNFIRLYTKLFTVIADRNDAEWIYLSDVADPPMENSSFDSSTSVVDVQGAS